MCIKYSAISVTSTSVSHFRSNGFDFRLNPIQPIDNFLLKPELSNRGGVVKVCVLNRAADSIVSDGKGEARWTVHTGLARHHAKQEKEPEEVICETHFWGEHNARRGSLDTVGERNRSNRL